MASTQNQVALSTTAALVVTGDQNAPSSVTLENLDVAIVMWWGYTSGVTTSTGVKLAAGAVSPPILLEPGESVYALAASGTPTIAYAKSRAQQRTS